MKILAISLGWSLLSFGVLASYSQLATNSRFLYQSAFFAANWRERTLKDPGDDENRLRSDTRLRALVYDSEIVRNHLDHGLVINRGSVSSEKLDVCDSLLFSAVRWVSLNKLGWKERARDAYRGLHNAHVEGTWIRHPECRLKSLSRDMLTGILLVLSQQPEGYQEDLARLVARIREGGGYFSDGPSYVSYLTPGLGKIIFMLLKRAGLNDPDVPLVIRDGYSTNELSLSWMSPGYEAHLAALSLWLEMEIGERMPVKRMGAMEVMINQLVRAFSLGDLYGQRQLWVSYRLLQIDPRNVFFKYLRLRSLRALTPASTSKLLHELMSMEQFPETRLPQSCDRKADYLWQRGSHEYDTRDSQCLRKFHGIDFLWMASLLLEALDSHRTLHLTDQSK